MRRDISPKGSDQRIHPIDVHEGLGTADRQLLAVSLALVDDSTLSTRVQQLADEANDWVHRQLNDGEIKETVRSVETRMAFWRNSALSDDDLRLTLWIYLRDALGLSPRLTRSTRGAGALADELTAAVIHFADPPGASRAIKDQLAMWGWREGDRRYTTLADVVQPVLQELIAAALSEGAGQMGAAEQEKLIADTRERLQALSEADQQRMLGAVGARELNDAAVRKILLTGGGLCALSASVSMAGFSAYILAAQASAFIPLVSGPALVSTVAVLSNPVTVVAATAAAVWWFATSANESVRVAVALRVVALLALQGLSAGRTGLERVLASFARMETLQRLGDVGTEVYDAYASEWHLLTANSAARANAVAVDPGIEAWMRRPITGSEAENRRWRLLLFPDAGEVRMTTTIGALTLGDLAYSAAAIDPLVIKAADFARVEAIDDPVAFAAFAQKIEAMDPTEGAGAISNVKGYVAEQVVAAELVAQGHQVEFPGSSNQEGWDLLVDGKPFQVKCLEEGSGLKEHFVKNPDIPVFANAEVADQVPAPWAGNVFFVEGYSNELITHVTDRSVKAGADMLEPDVPLFTVCCVAVRQLIDYRVGKVSGVQAVEQILLDGGTRAGLAVVGGFMGKTIGLLTFGPAGAMVLGSLVPALSQAQSSRVLGVIDGWAKPRSYQKWEVRADGAIDALSAVLNKGIIEKTDILRGKFRALDKDGAGAYVRARLLDDALYLDEVLIRLQRLKRKKDQSVEQRALGVIQWTAVSTVHPALYQTELRQLQSVLEKRPSLAQRTEAIVGVAARRSATVVRNASEWAMGFLNGLRDKR